MSFNLLSGNDIRISCGHFYSAYWVVGKEPPIRSPPSLPPINLTDAEPATENVTLVPSSSFEHTLSSILPHDLGADIFKGQVITIAVVIVFLTIFLLREWIIQNARPGVFGDDDVPEAAAAPEAPLANANIEPPPIVEVEVMNEEAFPPLEPIGPLELPAELAPVVDSVEEDDEQTTESETYETSPDSHENSTDGYSDEEGRSNDRQSNDGVSSIVSNHKGKQKAGDITDSEWLVLLVPT